MNGVVVCLAALAKGILNRSGRPVRRTPVKNVQDLPWLWFLGSTKFHGNRVSSFFAQSCLKQRDINVNTALLAEGKYIALGLRVFIKQQVLSKVLSKLLSHFHKALFVLPVQADLS